MRQKSTLTLCSWRQIAGMPLLLLFLLVNTPHQLQAGEEVLLATQITSTFAAQARLTMECAFKKINWSLKMAKVPWTRAQKDTRDGKYSGFFMASQNSTRDAYATFSQPFMQVVWVYVVRRNSDITVSDTDFKQKIFAANNGSARLNWLLEKRKKGDIVYEVFRAERTDILLRMLLLNRMDIVLENTENLERVAAKGEIDMTEFKILPARKKPMAVYFSHTFLKRNPEFLDAYNTAILACKVD